MKLKNKKLGEYIQQIEITNQKLSLSAVRGVSINKKFISTKANMKDVDISDYKVVKPNHFCFNPNTARMGNKIPIAFNNSEKDYLVSKIYPVFKVKDKNELKPEYLMLWFKREEFDRYARYHSWGSARETFNWDQMCEIELPIPDIKIQQKYVDLYYNFEKSKNLINLSFSDLEYITSKFLDDLAKKAKLEILGPYIEQIDRRNSKLEQKNLKGISILKKFIKSKANQTDLKLNNCKIVNKDEFAYVTVTSRNGNKISIALMEDKAAIVSSTYIVFKVKKTEKLLPKYLLLWFKRDEFDRYARYHSWGSARETFSWDNLCEIKLPIPSIDIQKSIIEIHDILEGKKFLDNEFGKIINSFCPTAIQGARDSLNSVK